MNLLLKKNKKNRYYYRDNSKKYIDEKHFFGTINELSLGNCFENVKHIERHFETKLISMDIDLNCTKTIKKLIKESQNFTIIKLDSNKIKELQCDFSKLFKENIIFQIVTRKYGYDFANFLFEMKKNKELKKYMVSIFGTNRDAISNLLGDDVIFHTSRTEHAQPIYLGTNRKTDINLLKICFENKVLNFVETKNFNSL